MRYSSGDRPLGQELADLVRTAQRGGDRALDSLLERLRPSLVAYFRPRLSASAADDLAQLALVRIARALDRIDPLRADRYISTVARNLLRTEYRRRAKELERSAPLELAEAVESPDSVDLELEYRELVVAVHRTSVSSLAPELGTIVLGLLRGLTTDEIAAREGVSPITIRTRLLRARALLRRELQAYLNAGARDDNRGRSSSGS